jgi:hypothetical protein
MVVPELLISSQLRLRGGVLHVDKIAQKSGIA